MSKKSIALSNKREKLEAELKQIKVAEQQEKALEARRLKKEEDRKKILIGAAVLNLVKIGRWPEDKLMKYLEEFLTRQSDRALFGFDPISSTPKTTGFNQIPPPDTLNEMPPKF